MEKWDNVHSGGFREDSYWLGWRNKPGTGRLRFDLRSDATKLPDGQLVPLDCL